MISEITIQNQKRLLNSQHFAIANTFIAVAKLTPIMSSVLPVKKG